MGEKRKGAQSRGDCCEKNDEQEAGNGGELEFRLHLARDSERKKGREKGGIGCQTKNVADGAKAVFRCGAQGECKITISFEDR